MSRNDDELNEFIDEVTDGVYNLPCVQVIFKLVKQMQSWGDDRIKKIVGALAVEGIKISTASRNTLFHQRRGTKLSWFLSLPPSLSLSLSLPVNRRL
jgi:hypothetical protein